MGGIAGYFSAQGPVETLARLATMLREIRHRGPDDAALSAIDRRRGPRLEVRCDGSEEALWEPCPHEIGLASCRLAQGASLQLAPGASLQLAPGDPSEAGRQPLWNESRSAVVACAGEVYNHPELRAELEKRGHRFRSGADAELFLRAFEEWDVDALPRLNGSFALAFYDLRRRRLVLARDRVGSGPLYLGVARGVLYFASEVRAILAAAGAEAFPVEQAAVGDFVLHGWRGLDDGTFHRGIRSLAPGSSAVVGEDLAVRPVRYWSLPERRLEEREIDLREACETLRDVLADAVRIRVRAAAPVAMELSGGLGSASLVALRAASDETARFSAYTVVREAAGDDGASARLVAARWPRRVDHRLLRETPHGFWERADALVRLAGEPLHAPDLLAIHEARRRVRADGFPAVIVGSGGDEVLAGDPHAYAVPFLASLLSTGSPIDVARELAAATRGQKLALARRLLLGAPKPPAPHPELAALVSARDGCAARPPRSFESLLRGHLGPWRTQRRLRCEDPARQGIPIAVRAPFLDYRVAELAFQLPTTYLIRHGFAKFALRRALEPLLPLPLVWRAERARSRFPWRAWLAASKPWILANAEGSSLACVQAAGLAARYDALADAAPQGLWRLASVLLWHRRCNEGRPLAAAPPAARA
jgi:asparagine synthase (glutamine-hydrolysing)